jgi:hypothetical protein
LFFFYDLFADFVVFFLITELNHPAHFKRPELPRMPLQAREYSVDVDDKIGKTYLVSPHTPLAQQGYYCDICDWDKLLQACFGVLKGPYYAGNKYWATFYFVLLLAIF